MFNGLTTDDMCKDYKRKFGIKKHKHYGKDLSLGINICKEEIGTYYGNIYDYYLNISLLKYEISIGIFNDVKNG